MCEFIRDNNSQKMIIKSKPCMDYYIYEKKIKEFGGCNNELIQESEANTGH